MGIFDRLFHRGEYRRKTEPPSKEKMRGKEKLARWQRALTIGFLGHIVAGVGILDMVPPTRAQVVEYTKSEVSRIMQANIDANRVEESLEIVPRPVREATVSLHLSRDPNNELESKYYGSGVVVGKINNPDQSVTYIVLTNKHVMKDAYKTDLISASLGARIDDAHFVGKSPYGGTMDYNQSPDLVLVAFRASATQEDRDNLKLLPTDGVSPGIARLPENSYLTTYGFPVNDVSYATDGHGYATLALEQYAAGYIVTNKAPDHLGRIQVSGVNSPGSSGSPVVNEDGKVIALNSDYMSNDSMLEFLLEPTGYHAHYVGALITPLPVDYYQWLEEFVQKMKMLYEGDAKD